MKNEISKKIWLVRPELWFIKIIFDQYIICIFERETYKHFDFVN